MAFVKLDRGLLSSSLWIEGDAETVRVWVYLLLAADGRGVVEETLPAIAYGCKISVDRAAAILDAFAAPDGHSRTPTAEGRRIVISREPRWSIRIVNFLAYREKDHGAAARMRRYRERKGVTRNDRNATSTVTQGRGQRAEGRERETDGTEARGTPESPPERPVPSRSLVTDETATAIEAAAQRLEALVPSLAGATWIARASTIPADAERAARSFTDPRRPGISEGWALATLKRLGELEAEASRPVPL